MQPCYLVLSHLYSDGAASKSDVTWPETEEKVGSISENINTCGLQELECALGYHYNIMEMLYIYIDPGVVYNNTRITLTFSRHTCKLFEYLYQCDIEQEVADQGLVCLFGIHVLCSFHLILTIAHYSWYYYDERHTTAYNYHSQLPNAVTKNSNSVKNAIIFHPPPL